LLLEVFLFSSTFVFWVTGLVLLVASLFVSGCSVEIDSSFPFSSDALNTNYN